MCVGSVDELEQLSGIRVQDLHREKYKNGFLMTIFYFRRLFLTPDGSHTCVSVWITLLSHPKQTEESLNEFQKYLIAGLKVEGVVFL